MEGEGGVMWQEEKDLLTFIRRNKLSFDEPPAKGEAPEDTKPKESPNEPRTSHPPRSPDSA